MWFGSKLKPSFSVKKKLSHIGGCARWLFSLWGIKWEWVGRNRTYPFLSEVGWFVNDRLVTTNRASKIWRTLFKQRRMGLALLWLVPARQFLEASIQIEVQPLIYQNNFKLTRCENCFVYQKKKCENCLQNSDRIRQN